MKNCSEQRFRQLYAREFDWVEFNSALMRRSLGMGPRPGRPNTTLNAKLAKELFGLSAEAA
ncbi:MAG: hypothetical protein LIP02_05445 [Bacteroidales bacterium]|nr:hypothetical protein [Bacteroidales bacterium]